MSDENEKPIKASVLRDFTDAGTEQIYLKGETPNIEAGAFRNYEAAGVVRKFSAEDGRAEKADAKAPAKPAT